MNTKYNLNNKKAFTLIELLAVIVILAVIALIATPILLNIIGGVKEGSFKESLNNVASAYKMYETKNKLEGTTLGKVDVTDTKLPLEEKRLKGKVYRKEDETGSDADGK